MRPSTRAALDQLRLHPVHSALVIVVLAAGVLGICAASIASEGLSHSFQAARAANPPADLTFTVQRIDSLTLRLLRHDPAVAHLDLRDTAFAEIKWRGYAASELIGVPPRAGVPSDSLEVTTGHYPSRNEIVLDSSMGSPHWPGVDTSISVDIAGHVHLLRVAGTGHAVGTSSAQWADHSTAYVRIDELRAIAGENTTRQALIYLRPRRDVNAVARRIAGILRKRHIALLAWHIGSDQSNEQTARDLFTTIRAISILLLLGGSILAAMSASTLARTLDAPAGPWRTLGIRSHTTIRLGATLAAAQGTAAGILGLLLGLLAGDALLRYLADLFGVPVGGLTLLHASLVVGPLLGILVPVALSMAAAWYERSVSSVRAVRWPFPIRDSPLLTLSVFGVLSRPWRFAPAVAALACCGAAVFTLTTVAASFDAHASGEAKAFHADALVTFPLSVPSAQARDAALQAGSATQTQLLTDQLILTRWGDALLLGPGPGRLYKPLLQKGRSLLPGELGVALIDNGAASRSHMSLGSRFEVDDGVHRISLRTVGVVAGDDAAGAGPSPLGMIIVSNRQASELTGRPPRYSDAILVAGPQNRDKASDLVRLRGGFERAGQPATVDSPLHHFQRLGGQLAAAYAVIYAACILAGMLAISTCITTIARDHELAASVQIARILGAGRAQISRVFWLRSLTLVILAIPLAFLLGLALVVPVLYALSRTVIDLPLTVQPLAVPIVIVVLIALVTPAALLGSVSLNHEAPGGPSPGAS